jgi:hypothetical protein
MISAYEYGGHAAQHDKHIQACQFDTGTPNGANGAKDSTISRLRHSEGL